MLTAHDLAGTRAGTDDDLARIKNDDWRDAVDVGDLESRGNLRPWPDQSPNDTVQSRPDPYAPDGQDGLARADEDLRVIDVLIAAVMAVGGAARVPAKRESIYKSRGLLTLPGNP